jgi:hypothetical protein
VPTIADLKDRSPRWLRAGADLVTRAGGLATVADRPPPDFLVIGTKRGGTTSLFNYLVQHPGILGLYPQPRGKKSTDFFFSGHGHDARWYRSHFHTETYRRRRGRALGYRPLSFEASPYYVWDPRVAARAAALRPSLKAVVLLRDPVRRAWSHYQERTQNGVEPLSFEDALAAEDDRLAGELERMAEESDYHSSAFDWYSYRSRGEYLSQIRNWHASFPQDQLLVLRSEDLYRSTQETVDRVCVFLGLPPFVLPETRPFNATWRTRDSPPEAASHALAHHFHPLNRELEDYLSMSFDW